MQRQLTWWATSQPPAATAPIWEELGQLEQMRVIAALARLISKAMKPWNSNRCKEDDHEQ
jgi:hypothetical protein